ncbi:MAG: hypothetical protein IKS92_04720, partial [Victivallales bacterium]|nr:hypothetical protein [Victivallales bacterium]
FIGEEPHASHGEPFHFKNHVRSYCAARFPKSRRASPPIFRHATYFTPLSRFCKPGKAIFSERATPEASREARGFHNELILFPLREDILEFI